MRGAAGINEEPEQNRWKQQLSSKARKAKVCPGPGAHTTQQIDDFHPRQVLSAHGATVDDTLVNR